MWIAFVLLLFAAFSAALASSKNRSPLGWFFIGLLFGPFGLVVGLMPAAEPAASSAYELGDIGAEYDLGPKLEPEASGDADPVSESSEALRQIERLAQLRESGALTDDEFETKKRELLSRV